MSDITQLIECPGSARMRAVYRTLIVTMVNLQMRPICRFEGAGRWVDRDSVGVNIR